jgi:hypothetical protein
MSKTLLSTHQGVDDEGYVVVAEWLNQRLVCDVGGSFNATR